MLATASLAASDAYPPPRFADPGRVDKLKSAMPEIDRIFRAYATDTKIPGMIWGVVIDGQLAHLGWFGVRDRGSQAPVTPDTAFRIASMTKSFTALAVLKLRDAGRLSLEDPVSRWIPQFEKMERPTRDTPPLTVRQLLSHSAGFAEDNPWGDQQLSATDAMMDEWLARGIPFSTPPGTRYEYSNYAFGLLGRVVTKAAGVPYEVVPGLSAALAAPALAGIPVTPRGLTSSFAVISGHAPEAWSALDGLAPGTLTLVVLMGLATRAALAAHLIERRWPAATPAAILIAAGTAESSTWIGTLGTLGAAPVPPQGGAPGTIVVGEVVSLARRGTAIASNEPELLGTASAAAASARGAP